MSCNMLSYVEHYQPNYFLLENVAGFLEHHIISRSTTSSGKVVTIKFGMVKFVARALIALGSEYVLQIRSPVFRFLTNLLQISSSISIVASWAVWCPPKSESCHFLGGQTRSGFTRLPYSSLCVPSWANESYIAHGREARTCYEEQKPGRIPSLCAFEGHHS
jgi:hypothetical protein